MCDLFRCCLKTKRLKSKRVVNNKKTAKKKEIKERDTYELKKLGMNEDKRKGIKNAWRTTITEILPKIKEKN